MSTNIYVGNLTFNTSSGDLETLFGAHGAVEKAQVVTDRDTGRSRGFGFVEMSSDAEANAAIDALKRQGRRWASAHCQQGQRTLTLKPSSERRGIGGTRRCTGCGHPRPEHRTHGCTVPHCVCATYKAAAAKVGK